MSQGVRIPCPTLGGGKGIRTPDLQLAKLPLYQLSYAPIDPNAASGFESQIADRKWQIRVVGVTGIEPVTLRLSSACSNQLSYTPVRAVSAQLSASNKAARAWVPVAEG